MVAAGDDDVALAAALHAATAEAAPLRTAGGAGVRGAACRVPAVVGAVGRGDAAFGEDVERFHAFHGLFDIHGGTCEVQRGIRMDTVVARGDRDGSAIHLYVLFAVDAVVGGVDLHGSCVKDDVVERLDAVVACGDVDRSARDVYDALALDDDGVLSVHGVFVTLDAVAACSLDGNGALFDVHKALALQAVVFRGNIHGGLAAEAQVVARVDAVVVVALHGKRAFALDGEVILRVDAGAGRIHLRLAVCVYVGEGLGARAAVGKRVLGAALCDDEYLARHLHVDGGVCIVREGEPAQVQVHAAVALGGVYANLGVIARVGTAEVVVARAGNHDLAAVHLYAIIVVRDGRSACRVGDYGGVSVAGFNDGLAARARGRCRHIACRRRGRDACDAAGACCTDCGFGRR